MRTRESAIALVAIAGLLLLLALGGGGRDPGPWTAFRLVAFALLGFVLLTGHVRRTALNLPFAAVAAVVAITSIWSVRLQSSLDQLLTWGAYAAVFLVVASSTAGTRTAEGTNRVEWAEGPERVQRVEWARRFVDAAVFTGGIVCLVGLYWFWGAGEPLRRWYSTFYWPNPFAGFLLLLLPVEGIRCLLAPSRRQALTHGAMAVLLGLAFVLTFSRGAWMAAAVAAIPAVLVVARSWRPAVTLRAAVLVVAAGAALFLLTRGQVFRSPTAGVLTRAASATDVSEYSLQGRLHFWRGAADILRDHPLVGTGPGTYTYVYPQYQRDVRFYARDPHNLFAQMAAESGLLGLAALIWLLGTFALVAVRVVSRARGTPEFPWIAGVALGVAGFWIHTGVEMNWSFPAGPATAFALMGVLAGRDVRVAAPGELVPRRRAWTRAAAVGGLAVAIVLVAFQYGAVEQFRTGRIEFAAGRWREAEQAFARASDLNPIDPRYPSARADALARLGTPAPALIPLVRRASALDRANPYYWVQVALLYRQLGTPSADAEAEAALRMAVRLDPYHYPEAYRHLAQLHRRRGDPAGALEVYRQAGTRYPDTVATDFALRPFLWPGVVALLMDWADLFTAQRRYVEAEAIYQRIVRLEPRFVPGYVQLAQLYLKTGRVPDAIRIVDAGLREVPDDRQLRELRRKARAMR